MRNRCGLAAAFALLLGAAPSAGAVDSAWSSFCGDAMLDAADDEAVNRAARAHARSAPHFHDLLSRGEPWLWDTYLRVQERGMPAEIALIPAIESGFKPRAASHRSAVGLWQLVPATARRFGLRVDDTLDQRLDYGHSTRTALDYLDYLHGRFDSWPLALAAYSAGEGRVVRALRAIGKRPGDAVARDTLRLPAETRAHYHRLLGLTRVICAPDAYGVHLPSLPTRPLVQVVHLDRPLPLSEIAAIAGVPETELEHLNPPLSAQGDDAPFRVWLPSHRKQALYEGLSDQETAAVIEIGSYRVRRGDTLSHIALRHGTSTHHLRELNTLPGSRIQIGMELRVPLVQSSHEQQL